MPGEEEPQTLEEWVKELRDRTHRLRTTMQILDGTISALMVDVRESKAETRELRGAVEQIHELVTQVISADELATKVAEKVRERRAWWFSIWAKASAGLAVMVAVAGGIKGLLS